ncbi:tetratricopeptide repeat domain 23, isoform CRA_c, partial [Mus musculus]
MQRKPRRSWPTPSRVPVTTKQISSSVPWSFSIP